MHGRKFVRYTLFGAGALSLMAFTACRHRGHGPERAQRFVTYMVNEGLDEVDATDDQRTAILASKDRLFNAAMEMRGDRQAMVETLLNQWQKETPDEDVVRALVAERMAAHQAFADQAVTELLQVHQILTPEQRTEIAERLEKHRDRWSDAQP